MKKTNAIRELDRLGIRPELREYVVDENVLDALTVAAKIEMPARQVFKTLVLRGDHDRDLVMACLPGPVELNLKKLAKLCGFKRVRMIAMKELQPLTGYVRGGCSPVGTKKRLPVYLDAAAMMHARIAVSAGVRGVQMVLAPGDLVKATGQRSAI